jgi:hypothetical protein
MEEYSKSPDDEATRERDVETETSATAQTVTEQTPVNLSEHTINVSFLENDTRTEQVNLTVPQLFEKLADHKEGVKQARRWSPGTFEPNHRKQDNCQEVSVLVFDVDENITLQDGIAAVEKSGLCAAIVTSYSHRIPDAEGILLDRGYGKSLSQKDISVKVSGDSSYIDVLRIINSRPKMKFVNGEIIEDTEDENKVELR